MTSYAQAMTDAMNMLAKDERVIFLGQAVVWPGTYMSGTLDDVPRHKRIEMPVAEEMQLGVSIGLAKQGFIPVSVFPRWNFLLLAANQLVNHLDKMREHVIIRVGVGSGWPLHPGAQHVGDFTDAFELMCRYTAFRQLIDADAIVPQYKIALNGGSPIVMVEYADLYK